MKSNLVKLGFCYALLMICLTTISAAQTSQLDSVSGNENLTQTVKAKREIIKILFSDIFRGESKEHIFLSTKNIPDELITKFPKLGNLTARLVADDSTPVSLCPFVFHSFAVNGNKAAVSFGNCDDGLGYNFEKVNGKWQFASSEIKRR